MNTCAAAELGAVLERVRQGLTTDADADFLLGVLREQAKDIAALVAVIDRETREAETD